MTFPKKIIFVDFDGVMTSQSETPGSYITNESANYGASPSCLNQLRQLCDETGAKIVISSNWRRFEDDGICSFWTHPTLHKTVGNPLPKFKKQMDDYIVDILPTDKHITKSQALILWFIENGLTQDDINYVIFDDDPAEGFAMTAEYDIRDHFIQTSAATGLTDADAVKAKSLLI